MNSFYGGKQGFGFILKGNDDADDHFFHNEEEILAAIANKKLRYGEYALLSFPDENNVDKIGNLYRVVHGNIELVANISGPAGATGAQGIQGPPGEKGEKGDAGTGFIYTAADPDNYAPMSTTITFEAVQGGRNVPLDETLIKVTPDGNNYNAYWDFNGTVILDNNYTPNKETFYNMATDYGVYRYDIESLLATPGDLLSIYKGGRLPPLIYIRDIAVYQGTGTTPLPNGLYMVLRNASLNRSILWKCLHHDTDSFSTDKVMSEQVVELLMIYGKCTNMSRCTEGFTILYKAKDPNNDGEYLYQNGIYEASATSQAGTGNDKGVPCYVNGAINNGYTKDYITGMSTPATAMSGIMSIISGGADLKINIDADGSSIHD